MSDESVVVEESIVVEESVVTEAQDTDTTVESDLADFEYQDYEQLFPEAIKDQLVDYFTTQRRGWKVRARKVKYLAELHATVEKLTEELVEFCTREHKFGPKMKSDRDVLRNIFAKKSDEQLQKASLALNVPYNSFMGTGDREGLIEALCDEMEAL